MQRYSRETEVTEWFLIGSSGTGRGYKEAVYPLLACWYCNDPCRQYAIVLHQMLGCPHCNAFARRLQHLGCRLISRYRTGASDVC